MSHVTLQTPLQTLGDSTFVPLTVWVLGSNPGSSAMGVIGGCHSASMGPGEEETGGKLGEGEKKEDGRGASLSRGLWGEGAGGM